MRILAGFLLCLLASCASVEAPIEADYVLRGGAIVDGTGRPAFTADLAIRGDRVIAIGALGPTTGEDVNVRGLVVAPGFVNIHSHAAANALPTAVNMLSQGVTTEIVNADGFGPVDLEAQLALYADNGLAVNVGAMIGFNAVWGSVLGEDDVRPSPEQIALMQRRVAEALDDGAWGISAGLDYPPGYYATEAEVVRVLAPFGGKGLVFSNHDRVTAESGFSSITGMSETLRIGEAAGLVPLVTHMKLQGREQGRAEEMLARMRTANVDFPGGVPADQYPYTAGLTSFPFLVMPNWALAGGLDAARARFADPEVRARIVRETEAQIERRWGGTDAVVLLESNRTLTEAMAELGLASAGEAVVRLADENPMQPMVLHFGAEADVEAILVHPTTSVSCDCGASIDAIAHPRTWGTFPRVLGEYVRERGLLSLEEAVRKMSGLPATTIGMPKRGVLHVGAIADIAVFDPETVRDRATYAEPTLQSEGVVHTLVAGRFAWRDNAATGEQAGKALKRPFF